MSPDEARLFSASVTSFLQQQTGAGAELSIPDEELFSRFRVFWMQLPQHFDHPALLGQFRVELVERGYATTHGKRPHWLGLALREATGRMDREMAFKEETC